MIGDMRLRTLTSRVPVNGKRVLLRIDANVAIARDRLMDGKHGKTARAAVDIEFLRQRGAKIILLNHLGRPEGKRVTSESLRPVARRLRQLVGVDVPLCREAVGPIAQKAVSRMQPGDVLLLENLRFYPGEEENSKVFAEQLAALGDLYVNDAFSVCHRAHASVDAITEFLPSYAGPLLAHEVEVLDAVASHPRQPFVLVVGGLKMESKLPLLERFLPVAENVLVGGALAHVFLRAQGFEIGTSAFDPEGLPAAKRLLAKKSLREKLVLPTTVLATHRGVSKAVEVAVDRLTRTSQIVDIGPETVQRFVQELPEAKMIVWNGPMGNTDGFRYVAGTKAMAQAIAARTGKAKTVVGGGDTIAVIDGLGLSDKFNLVSTGGGAMLEFLGGKALPGLEALRVN